MFEPVITKTIEYLSVPSVVGYEQPFMNYLEADFNELGLHVYKTDRYLAVSGAEPLSAILCAHIDRHGLISIGEDEYVYAAQYIKEIKYGENNRLAREQIQNIAERFEGEMIYAYNGQSGERLGEGLIKACNTCMLEGDTLFFVENMQTMECGVPLAYARTGRFDGNIFKGQIDNAVSLGVVHELFRQGFQGTAILSTEEEIGKSWIHLQAYLEESHIESKCLLVLDTSPYTKAEAIENGYIVFRNRDMSEEFNPELVTALKARAADLKLEFQVKDEMMLSAGKTVNQLGSTELGKLVRNTEGRWNGATVQIPTLMYHTSNETTTAHAIENYITFLRNVLIDDKLAMLNATGG